MKNKFHFPKTNCSFWLFFLLLFLLSNVFAEGHYSLSNRHIYKIRYLIGVENKGGTASEVKLQIPLFITNGLPSYQRVINYRYPEGVRFENTSDSSTAIYYLPQLAKGQRLQLEFDFTIINSAIDYELQPYGGSFQIEEHYLKPEAGIESDAEPLVQLASRITDHSGSMLEKAKKIFSYVNDNLTYELNSDRPASALKTLKTKQGMCEDYSLLYIALCRAAGIPARFVSGYRFSPELLNRSELDLEQSAHAWVEVCLPVTGWIPVEPTFNYTYNGVKTVNYDYFGKITPDDRHLLFNYSRRSAPSYTWKYHPGDPARLELTTRMLLRKVE